MTRRFRSVGLLAALLSVSVGISGQNRAGTSTLPSLASGDWPHYTADIRGTKYSPLDQINADNFKQARGRVAFQDRHAWARGPSTSWRARRWRSTACSIPTGGTRRSVVALDGKTGELLWAHSLREGKRAGVSPRQLSGRGLSYWTDGRGDDRVIYVTTGYRLVALNAHNGAPIAGFGKDGIVDLKEGVVFGAGQQIDLETGEIGVARDARRSRRTSSSSARRSARARPSARTTTPRVSCGRSTCAPASCSGRSTRSRCPASSATTRGRRTRGR